jgi:hypothetical protein
VRHMGWKRFKCKLCCYLAFNRSDIKTHLRRVHPAKTAGIVDMNKFIVNLDEEGNKTKTNRSRSEIRTPMSIPKDTVAAKLKNAKSSPSPQTKEGRVLRETSGSRDRSRSAGSRDRSRSASSIHSTKRMSPRVSSTSPNDNQIISDYNISTRRISRIFDLRPCRSNVSPTTSNRKRSLPDADTDCVKPAKVARLE